MAAKIYSHSTATDTSSYTPDATYPARQLKGPPRSGAFAYGIYILQTANGANSEYRWFDDVQTPGTKAPTTYSAL